MDIVGTIKSIGEIITYPSGFQRRDFVLVTEEQYPQPILIELLGQKIDIIEPFTTGERVIVGINFKGREWTYPNGETKYFNSITAWKIIKT